MMKKLALLLCVAIISNSIPVYAVENLDTVVEDTIVKIDANSDADTIVEISEIEDTGLAGDEDIVGGAFLSDNNEEELSWSLNRSTGALVISGNAAMYMKTNLQTLSAYAPWSNYKNEIITAEIKPGVTTIGNNAFYECKKLQSISIPETVEAIGADAFIWCVSLDNVVIPDSVKEIKADAFNCCEGLMNISLPVNITKIADRTFNGCKKIEEITLPSKIESIGVHAFMGCSALKEITIPQNVTEIKDSGFMNCTSLERVSLPENLTTLGYRAFLNCSSLESIALPDGLSTMGDQVFSRCTSLINIVLPEGLTQIGSYEFSGCSALESADLEKANVSVGKYMFSECENLTTVKLNPNTEVIDERAFYCCKKLNTINLPNKLKTVGTLAFAGCSLLTGELVFPESMKTVGDSAFYGTGFSSCSFPEGMESIGARAFWECFNLKTITVLSPDCECDYTSFYENAGADIYGYSNSNLWKSVRSRIKTVFHYLDQRNVVGGSCGASVYWKYNLDTKKLTVYGSGKANCAYECERGTAGLLKYKADALEIVVEEGITALDRFMFYSFTKLNRVEFPSTMTLFSAKLIGASSSGCDIYIKTRDSKFECSSMTLPNSAILHIYKNSTADDYARTFKKNNVEYYDPETKDDYIVNGFAGRNVKWKYDEIAKTLTVYGEGPTYKDSYYYDYVGDFDSLRNAPFSDEIEHVYIEDGVTDIAQDAFNGKKIKDVDIAESVTIIGNSAFANCQFLENIYIHNDNINISDYAFFEDKYSVINCNKDSKAEAEAKRQYISYKYFDDDKIYGYCNSAVKWELSGNELIVSGSGDMPDTQYYDTVYYQPYKNLASYIPFKDRIQKVVIEDGITGIGKYNFYELDKLESVELPDSLVNVSGYAFYGCEKLVNIILPRNIKTIGTSAFEGCESLIEIDIPASMTAIGSHSFKGCSALEKIVINNAECNIGYSNDPEHLPEQAVIFGHTASTAQTYAKKYDRQFFCMDDGVMDGVCGEGLTWHVDTNQGVLIISGTGAMNDYSYSYSGTTAPWNLYKNYINKLVVEEGVTTIGSYAFYYFRGLTDIKLPNSLKEIHEYAFYGCSNAGDIHVPSGVVVQNGAFYNCTVDGEISIDLSNSEEITKDDTKHGFEFIKELVIPASVKRIGEGAFGRLYGLRKITIFNPDCEIFDSADTIYSGALIRGYSDSTAYEYAKKYNREFEAIDELTFLGKCGPNLYYCLDIRKGILEITGHGSMYDYTESELPKWEMYGDKIDKIILPNEITTIGNYGFYNCTAFKELVLPEGLTSIGDYGFCGCSSLVTIILPNTLTNIGVAAFKNCINLVVISIPEGVVKIQDKTFEGCDDLEDVKIENKNLTSIGDDAFKKCPSLKPVPIPSTTIIGTGVFDDCDSITAYNKLSNVEEVKDETFYGCEHLEVIWIPESVKKIGLKALAECIRLKKVTIMNKNCDIYDAEDTIYETAEIYGYRNSTAQKYAKKYGRKFIALEGTYVSGVVCDGILYEIIIDQNKLVISGTGEIPDYENRLDAPWYEYKDYIKTIEISEGITVIGKNSFTNMKHLEEVKLPETVSDIGQNSFSDCDDLEDIDIPEGANVDPKAFNGSDIIESKDRASKTDTINNTTFEDKKDQIKTIVLPGNVKSISENSFADYYWLDKIVIENPECEIFDSGNTIYKKTVIYGYKNSTAQAYAEKYGREFVDLAANSGDDSGDNNGGSDNGGNQGDNDNGQSASVFDEILKKNSDGSYSVVLVKGGKVSIEDIKKAKSDGKEYSVSSGNKKVAIATAKGVITGKSAGTTVITIKKPGKEILINVTVTEPKFAQKKITMNVGDVIDSGFSGTSLKPEYSINKTSIATVDSSGKITAVKKGGAVLTVNVNNKKYKLKIKVVDAGAGK